MFTQMLCFVSICIESYPQVPSTQPVLCTTKNSDFKEYRYKENIPYCRRNVSQNTKKLVYSKYEIPSTDWVNYTIDHIYPLSLGGSNDVNNLWPEHKDIKKCRYMLETKLYIQLKEGLINHKTALNEVYKVKYKEICAGEYDWSN